MTSVERESRIAALLAAVLETDDWCRPPTSNHANSDAAARAVELYRQIEPIFHGAFVAGEEGALDVAAGALGEVADGYALRSVVWEGSRLETLPVPSRPAVEALLRSAGVEKWAAALGHPLCLRSESESGGTLEDVTLAGPPDLRAVASTFADTVSAYGNLVVMFEYEEGRKDLRSESWRVTASRQVGSGRSWGGWVRARLGFDAPFGALIEAMFDISRGGFLLSWDSAPAPPFATRPYIRSLLQKEHADRWLLSHGVELPDWLRKGAET